MSKSNTNKTETKRLSVSLSMPIWKKLMKKMIEETGSTNTSDYLESLIQKDIQS